MQVLEYILLHSSEFKNSAKFRQTFSNNSIFATTFSNVQFVVASIVQNSPVFTILSGISAFVNFVTEKIKIS